MNCGYEDKKYLTKKNIVSFALSGFGQNLIIGYVGSFILFFYTDIFLIGAAPAGILMIVARIWDALNDPIMGTIVDKTRTKWGKMRPYLLITPIPLAVSTILVFLAPSGLSQGGRIAYASITYILWGMIYTVCDVPFWGLASVMTPNPKERISFISISRLFHTIGSASPMLIVPIVTSLVGDAKGYTLTGIIIGIVGGGLFFLSFFGTKERCESKDKAPTLKQCFQYLGKNQPLKCVVSANILGFMRALPVAAGMYVATYIMKDNPFGVNGATMNTILLAFWGVAGYLAMLCTPKICKYLNFRQIYYISSIVSAASCILMYLLSFIVGMNVYMIILMLIIPGFAFGLVSNINYSMIADSVDYVEWKTGKRMEGITVSFQTLMNKMMGALQTATVALALIVIGFDAPVKVGDEIIMQEQSKFTLNGMFWTITILPAIGWLISMVPMKFYHFIGDERAQAHMELMARREAANIDLS